MSRNLASALYKLKHTQERPRIKKIDSKRLPGNATGKKHTYIYNTYTQQTSTLNDTTVIIDVYIFYKNTLASMYTCSWSFPKPSYVPSHGAFPLPTPSSFEGLILHKTYLLFQESHLHVYQIIFSILSICNQYSFNISSK